MADDPFVLRARKRIQRAIAAIPPRRYRWEILPLPGEREAHLLVVRGRAGQAGFDVRVGVFPHGIEVACGEWHTHAFERSGWEDEEGLCSAFGDFLQALLSPATRLVVETRRGRPCRWRLEWSGEDGWKGVEEVRRIHLPWGRKGIEVRQNDLLPAPLPPGRSARGGGGILATPGSWR